MIQEALGTLNNSSLSRAAVEYAYEHGVTVIASAADEAAQHHNWPSSLPHVIIVNSITQYDLALTPANRSYLQFNGCTNFSSKITIAIPSVSCSSDATGRGVGHGGADLQRGAERARARRARPPPDLRAHRRQRLRDHAERGAPDHGVGRASTATAQADDVNFAQQPEPSCTQAPRADLHRPEPERARTTAPSRRPLATTKRYPARRGHDQFYGYGRVNMNRAVDALVRTGDAAMPPEVEITSPDWYDQVDPGAGRRSTLRGQVYARGAGYTLPGLRGARLAAEQRSRHRLAAGRLQARAVLVVQRRRRTRARSTACSPTSTCSELQGALPRQRGQLRRPRARHRRADLERAPEHRAVRLHREGRGAARPGRRSTCTGEDRRNIYLHRDQDMLPGFPQDSAARTATASRRRSSSTSTATTATSWWSGRQRRVRPRLPPGRLRAAGLAGARRPAAAAHRRARVHSGEVSDDLGGAILASVAAADIDRDGAPEVVGADMEGKVYVWDDGGNAAVQARVEHRLLRQAAAAVRERALRALQPDESKRHRTQHGFVGSPGAGRPRRQRRRAARDRGRGDGPPRLRLERRRLAGARLPGAGRRPLQDRVDRLRRRTRSRSTRTPARRSTRARSSTRRRSAT